MAWEEKRQEDKNDGLSENANECPITRGNLMWHLMSTWHVLKWRDALFYAVIADLGLEIGGLFDL